MPKHNFANDDKLTFRYGHQPKGSELVVLQDKEGKKITFVRPVNPLKRCPDCEANPASRKQLVGQVIMPDGGIKTLFAQREKREPEDPKGTLRMKDIHLI